MIVFSAAESKVQSVLDDRVPTKNTKIKEVCRDVCYGFDGPVMWAQTLTMTSVRQAPANPETRNFI